MTAGAQRHALVFGATGFLGRHLVLTLLSDGVAVTAAGRSDTALRALANWLARNGSVARPRLLRVRFDAPDLGAGDPEALAAVTEIYNCAGAYRFGMRVAEARAANVDSVRAIVALAARLGRVERIVHVSGYRVGGQDPATVPWDAARVARTYRKLGAYEASKVEADAVFQAAATQAKLPWTIVNPSSVSGVGATGASEQYLGLAASFQELWNGTLAALPGNDKTFVPVVPVDYLARFMALLPADPTTAGRAYWVLDDATPSLPELLARVGAHYRVRVPRLRVPVALVRHLPRALTKADPETVGFLSSDRYPVGEAEQLAARHGLRLPETVPAILRWADDLAAHRFGAVPRDGARGFTEYAGVRTFQIGPARPAALVLPGPPANADTWQPAVPPEAMVVDLPGFGMSSGDAGDWPRWLDALVRETGARHLVGHGLGAAAAVAGAHRLAGRVDALTLVAPCFWLAPLALTRFELRCARPEPLSTRLTGSAAHADALRGAASDLRRPGAARRVAKLLRRAARADWQREPVEQLAGFSGRLHVIVGSRAPLVPWAADRLAALGDRARLTVIDGAGHHPQLTHPEAVAAAIAADLARALGAARESTEDIHVA